MVDESYEAIERRDGTIAEQTSQTFVDRRTFRHAFTYYPDDDQISWSPEFDPHYNVSPPKPVFAGFRRRKSGRVTP